MLAQAFFGAAISSGVGTAFAVGTSQIAAAQAGSFFLSSFGKSFALGVANQVLTPKGLGQPIMVNEKDPISPRQIIYGSRRVGGTIVAIGTSDYVKRLYENDGAEAFERYQGNNNKFLHQVIAIAGHEITSIDELYFNELKVSNGATSGDQFPFDINTDFKNLFDAAPTAGSQAHVCRFRLGTSSQTAISDLIFNSSDLQPPYQADYSGDSSYPFRTAEAYVSNSDDPVSFAGIDANFKLNGTAYIYFRGFHDNGLYKDGVPKITVKVKGKPIHDPRTGTTAVDSQLDNPALIIRDYLLDTKYGLGVASDEIDETAFETAADACDALVSDGDGGTQKRYTMSAVFNSENTPREVIDKMLTSCGGQLVYTNGKFRLLVGEYRTPSISLNEDHLISAIRISTKNSARQSYNKVQGTFFSEVDNYLATDYPVQTDASFVTADGRESGQILDLPFTMNAATAQRLARLHLVRSRQETTISFDANLNALELTAGDTFQLTNSRMGWTNKVFEVVDTRLNINGLSPSVTITAVETAQSIYTAADSGNFIDAIISENNIYGSETTIQPPESLSVSSEGVLDEDGKVQSKWTVTFLESPSQNDLLSYEIQWKLSTDTVYDVWDMGTETSLEGVGGVVVGSSYNVRVRAKGKNGQYSDFITATHTMAGDTTAPGVPSGLTATGGIESVVLDWTDNTETDFKHYQVFRNTTNSIPATPIATVDASQFVSGGLAESTTYYFWVKSVDFSGNVSAATTAVSATTAATPSSGADGADGADGDDGAGTYTYNLSSGSTSGLSDSTVTSYFTSASGRSPVVSDVLIVKRTDDSEATAYIRGSSTWSEQTGGYFHGDVLIEGTLTVDKLKSGNLSTNVSFELGDGTQVVGYDTGAGFISDNASYVSAIFENSAGGVALAGGQVNGSQHTAGFYNATTSSYSAFNTYVELAASTYAINAQGKIVVGGNDAISSSGIANFGGSVYGLAVSNNASYYILMHPNITNGYYYGRKDTDFRYNPATNVVTIGGTASPFTGSHEALIANTETIVEGDIVVDSAIVAKKDISNVLTLITKSTSTNQKSVIGVFSTKTDDIPVAIATTQTVMTQVSDGSQPLPNKNADYAEVDEVTRIVHSDYTSAVIGKDYCLINAVGEGQINVCNEGGNIEAGDLIVTSSMAGKGMKQSDDIVRNYTVAKARESVTFSSDTDVQQIACIYLCG